ncbi:uncharacterized protein MYCGRDRAFT_91435 [Zymoseptoria tritici IPO323]|uniref:Uncharacterized protein n=1 Tax=Zymoseptoria tritici (strain CBS 115943 / IPO323) TaxID=336722 RepID=F9X7K3_ZYMTI|nr:uncharacterized protein MYCGRDRAFT_91435 [Zymoseptoria tritici IPO323]EGP89559.1 hypothetical protein MYCGRDRAFT_91435 [Zymoseptoria tritici IPO323]
MSLHAPPKKSTHTNRLSNALLTARSSFSADTTSPIRLSSRVLTSLHTTSASLLKQLLRLSKRPGSEDYDMIHIRTSPKTTLTDDYKLSATYDTVLPRQHFHFDIYRSLQKLNAAEDVIQTTGFTVSSSLQEINLIFLLLHLRGAADSYEIKDEASHEPTIVRTMNEDHIIQAFKMLTSNFTMFLVHRPEDGGRQRLALVRFEDRVVGNRELEVATQVWYHPELAEGPLFPGELEMKKVPNRKIKRTAPRSGDEGRKRKRQKQE